MKEIGLLVGGAGIGFAILGSTIPVLLVALVCEGVAIVLYNTAGSEDE